MKKILFLISMLLFLTKNSAAQETEIEWASIDTLDLVLQDSANNKKHFFIDVYTDWCGWCKKMDASTFKDPEIVRIMNAYFIPVKFDAEQKESIQFSGREFKFVDNGRRGYNELAVALLQSKMSYPTMVLLNEKVQMIQPLPGYKTAADLKPILLYIGEGHYKTVSYPEYLESTK